MLGKILCLSISLLFSFTSILEVSELVELHGNQGEVSQELVSQMGGLQDQASYENSDCDNCEDCKEHHCGENDHCGSSCHSLSVYFIQKQRNMRSPKQILSTNNTWDFYFDYREPFLDPALKPPLHS